MLVHTEPAASITVMNESRRHVAWLTSVEVLKTVADDIDSMQDLNITKAAAAVGIAPSSFYRWLSEAPDKIDSTAVAALADYLHEIGDYADYAARWKTASRKVKLSLKKQGEVEQA